MQVSKTDKQQTNMPPLSWGVITQDAVTNIIYLFNLVPKFILQRCQLDFQPNNLLILGSDVWHDVSVTVGRHKDVVVQILKLLLEPLSLQKQEVKSNTGNNNHHHHFKLPCKISDLGGWLYTEMVYRPKTVTHPGTNRAKVQMLI